MAMLQQQRLGQPTKVPRRGRQSVVPTALFKKKSSTVVVEEKPSTTKGAKKAPVVEDKPKPKQGALSQALNALDFTSTRSQRDADLLYEAKYGNRGDDGKMTPEQYQALRRKVIGTARDYWKDWVEEEQVKTVKTYYKPDDAGGNVPYLGVLVGIVVAMLATTVLVVIQTSS
ncbi:hypothetical protein PLESTB_001595400 [Pleodorina starrii]|uniref:Uncharacterized protein n=1 Tax=Pleodorina starrii TaxID=330485 RepID=A0A9W6BYU3_9CHLO|nr:hypothetical protein PLESTM_000575600 [Pleodorina starrii]GLC60295.1 hypothetical protein PLESTB_001595400 [Pleodorina starrii]GLC66056.1 hypothetical protein PLESTF_000376900 [Pleodorina starrii]